MRKLLLKMNVSLDGFAATTGSEVEWAFASFDDELRATMVDELWEAGVHAMGRVTYGDMAAYWPTSDEPYAPPMNEIPKVVFSRTLTTAPWPETTIAGGDLADEVARLKQQDGGAIMVHGGAGLAQALTRLGLIDEYRLIVHPVALGTGLPLFGGPVDLKLVECRAFPAGAIRAIYRPA